MQSLRCVKLSLFILVSVAAGGINWKAVWIEPTPVLLTVGDTKPYRVMGLNGADVKADLTQSPYMTIYSSNPDVVEIDRKNAVFIAKKPGQAEIRVSFSFGEV